MFDKNDEHALMTLEELLPMGFGPEKLLVPSRSREEGGSGGGGGGGGGARGGGREGGGGSRQEVEVGNIGKATPAFMD